MRLVKFILAISATILIAACSFGEPDPGRALSISRAESGDVAVLYKPCVARSIETIRLVDQFGTILGNEDDRILWEVRAVSPFIVENTFSLIIGLTPDGFEEVVPLTIPLEGRLGLIVLTDRQTTSEGFEIDDLQVGMYRTHRGDYLTLEAFEEFDTCDP